MNQPNPTDRPLPDALEFWQWIDHVDQGSDCLTIADVRDFDRGQRVQLLVMDRNLCDHVYPGPAELPRGLADAHQFFDPIRDGAVYVHEENLHGRIEWGWDHDREHANAVFEFDVEYKHGHWYPLQSGILPAEDPQGIAAFEHDEPVPWYKLPKSTRVGWRGPMMRWSRLVDQPRVFTEIKLDRLAAHAAVKRLEEAGVLPADRHPDGNWLERIEGDWVLTARGLSGDELLLLSRRLPGVKVQGTRRPGIVREA